MAGAALSGRLAGRITPRKQVALGYALMGAMAAINVAGNALAPAALPWALLPAGLIALGWAMAMPAVTLLVLDTFPTRRGMASSLQGAMGGALNGVTAGVIAPIAMVSPLGLACASALMIATGWVAWWLVRGRVQLA
jgi:DHA1 family bicyclomycin/chloramphenicol resistance-like MFS transporter